MEKLEFFGHKQFNSKYTDGILLITLPKKEEVKPKPVKRIDIM
ncbi:MAG: Hsp20 family protein [Mariniphaga sp.]